MFDENSDLKKLSYSGEFQWDRSIQSFIMDALESPVMDDPNYDETEWEAADHLAASLVKTKQGILHVGGPSVPLQGLAILYVYECISGENSLAVALSRPTRTVDDATELLGREKELTLIENRIVGLVSRSVREYFRSVDVTTKANLDTEVLKALKSRLTTLINKSGVTGQRNLGKRLFVAEDIADESVVSDSGPTIEAA